jgi:hypothetical protein
MGRYVAWTQWLMQGSRGFELLLERAVVFRHLVTTESGERE